MPRNDRYWWVSYVSVMDGEALLGCPPKNAVIREHPLKWLRRIQGQQQHRHRKKRVCLLGYQELSYSENNSPLTDFTR